MTMPEYDFNEWDRPEVRAEIEAERQEEQAEAERRRQSELRRQEELRRQQEAARQQIIDRINQQNISQTINRAALEGLPYQTTGEMLNVIRTSNADKYIVQMQLKGAPTGQYRPVYLTRDEVIKMGGEIPIERNWKPGEGQRTEQSEARAESKRIEELKNLPTEKDYVLVGRNTPEPEYILKEDAERIKAQSPTLYDQLIRDGVSAYNQSVATEYRIAEAIQVESIREFEETLKDAPEELQKAFKEGGTDGYNRAVKAYNERVEQSRTEFEAGLKDLPEELQHAYDKGGVKGYNDAVIKYNLRVDQELKDFEKTLMDKPQELQDAYKTGGIEAYNKAVEQFNTKGKLIELAVKQQLEPYKDASGGYNIAEYLKAEDKSDFKVDKVQLLKDAGFKTDDINEAVYYSKLNTLQTTWQGTTPWNEYKGETVTLKGAATMAAETLVPLVWLKDVKTMKPWEIGVNAGLDLLILVPVAGWGARAGSKLIVKAGTATIAKSLSKELPRALVKAGSKELAAESRKVATKLSGIDKAMTRLEKAATATVKAEKSRNMDKIIKALQNESAARVNFANQFRRVGADIAALNSKIEETSLKGMSRNGLKKAVGMASKADDFAEYLADTTKDMVRLKINRSLPVKVRDAIVNQLKGYGESVQNVKDFAIAGSKTPKAGAKYLLGESSTTKIKGKITEKAMKGGKKEVERYLKGIEKQLASSSVKGQARLAKYGGKSGLDKWDRYIKETWGTGGGGGGVPVKPGGGGTAVLTRTGGGIRQAEKAGVITYGVPIGGMTAAGAGRVIRIAVDGDNGTTTVIPETITYEPGKVKPYEPPDIKPFRTTTPIIKQAEFTGPGGKSAFDESTKVEGATKQAQKIDTIPTSDKVPVPIGGIRGKIEPVNQFKTQPEQKYQTKIDKLKKLKLKTAVFPLPIPIPPKGKGGSDDKEKREFLKGVTGIVARRRGQLAGKDVWIVNYFPYKPENRMVILGAPPEGAVSATGKGSVQRSATVIRGTGPSSPIMDNTGAVDDVITSSGRTITIRSVKDNEVRKSTQRYDYRVPNKRRKINITPLKARDLGGGVEETRKGRHIKL